MRKTIREKIQEYLFSLKENGHIKPGELIPSFHALMKEFNTSYATVQNAIEVLAKDGFVERRQGVGTFLSSVKPLPIELGLCSSSFPFRELNTILSEFCRERNLYIDLTIRDRRDYLNHNISMQDRRVVIAEVKLFDSPHLGNLLDLSGFPDSAEVFRNFSDLPVMNKNVFLPFAVFSGQMAINRRIFKGLGVSERLTDDFSWWDDFVKLCLKKNVHPAVKTSPYHALWHFEKQLPLFYALSLGKEKDFSKIDRPPVFNTVNGKRFLNMLKSFTTFKTETDSNPSFENGTAAVSFNMGSWFTVQHEKTFGLAPGDFKIIPYLSGKRKICNFELSGLMTFIPSDMTPDEKTRVWELLKILVSKEFQIRLAAMSGMLSVRKDVTPREHPWNIRTDYSAFFAGPDDIKIYNNIYNPQVIAALSALCEQFEDFGANISQILKNMDEKIRSIHEPT